MISNKRSWTVLWFFIFLIIHPNISFAHSALLEAYPSINSHLDVAPDQIKLKFNERLEKELFYIHVFDDQGKLVTDNGTDMNLEQTEISLNLPPISKGNYTVSYQVISADGHPVNKAYLFSVGNISEKYDPNRYAFTPDHGNAFDWFIRTLYYFAFLALCGLTLWKHLYPTYQKKSEHLFGLCFKYSSRAYLSIVILVGVIQFVNVWQEFGIGDVPAAFFQTTSGLAWCAMFSVTIVGIFFFQKYKCVDLLLVLLLVIGEGINGHAVTFHPIWLSVFLDMVHLIAAAMWLGGLLYLLMVWKDSEKKERMAYLQLFSKMAFWSILSLLLTGMIITYIFLPAVSYLFHTQWGIMIVIKSIFLLLVTVVASLIRKQLRERNEPRFWFWMKWDYAILSLILFVVGGLTNAGPIPANDPFLWVQRQNNLLLNMEVTPNNPGVNNTFNVVAELPKGKKVKEMELTLIYQGQQHIAPIMVPLKSLPNNIADMNRYCYTSVGPFLSIPGDWEVQINIEDENDNWTIFKKKMTIYPVKKR